MLPSINHITIIFDRYDKEVLYFSVNVGKNMEDRKTNL